MYRYTDGGLRNVWLANGYLVKETPYGEAVANAECRGGQRDDLGTRRE